MGRCLRALLALAPLALACRGQDDQATRPLPAPEPPRVTGAQPLEPVAPPAERPRERVKAPRPEAPREEPPSAPPPDVDATATSAPSPTPSALPPASAVALPGLNAACQQACQGSLQTCLAQVPSDPEGGTSLEGLAACKRALDDCKSKCAP